MSALKLSIVLEEIEMVGVYVGVGECRGWIAGVEWTSGNVFMRMCALGKLLVCVM